MRKLRPKWSANSPQACKAVWFRSGQLPLCPALLACPHMLQDFSFLPSFLPSLSLFLLCVHMYVFMCAHVPVCACCMCKGMRGQRSTLAIAPQESSTLPYWDRVFHLNPGLTQSAPLTGQWAYRFFLSLLPQCWDYKYVTSLPAFHMGSGKSKLGPWACNADTLPIKLCPQPPWLHFLDHCSSDLCPQHPRKFLEEAISIHPF